MGNAIWNRRATVNVISLTLVCLISAAPRAAAQSEGRIPEVVTSDLQAPTFDDYAAYLRDAFPRKKKADDENLKKKLSSLKKLAAADSLNKVTRSKVLAKLAELYVELADSQRADELQKFNDAYGAWLDLEPRGKKPTFSGKESLASLQDAVQTYRALMAANPKTQTMPRIVHSVATVQARMGNENAELYYKKILKSKGVWRGLAALGMAEHMFDRGDLAQAGTYYKKLAKARKKEIRQYAEYKLAWTMIRTAEKEKKPIPAEAVETLKEVANKSKILKQSAQSDLVYVWSELGQVAAAQSFFTGDDVEYYYKTLERTAWKLRGQNKNVAATKTYVRLLEASKTRTYNYRTHGFLLEALFAAGGHDQVVAVSENMKQLYAGKDSPWIKANKSTPNILERAKDKLRANLYFYSTAYHRNYREKKDKNGLLAAVALYALYLDVFPEGDEAYKLRYAYADALSNLGRREDAAKQYLEVARAGNMDAKYRNSASEQMLNLQLAHVKAINFKDPPKVEDIKKPLEIPGPKKLLVEIFDTYAKFFPDRQKVVTLKFMGGKIFMEYGHFEEAIKRLDHVANNYSGTTESREAVKLILDTHARRQAWGDLVSYCRNYLKIDQLGGATRSFVVDKLNLGMWQQALALSKDKKHVPAAEAFIAFVEEFPRDDKSDQGLYTATNHYYAAGLGLEGIKTASVLVASYTSSKYRPNAQYMIGSVYEQLVEYEKAALSFARFAGLFRSDSRAPEAMYKAAELYRDAENVDAAAKSMLMLAKQFPTSSLAAEARLRYAEFKEESGEFGVAQDAYEQFVRGNFKKKADDELYAQAKVVALAAKANADKESYRQDLEKTLAKLPRDKAVRARDVLVEQMLRSYQDAFAAFSARKIGYIDLEIFSESDKQLQTDLDKIESSYKRAIALASDKFQVAAYYTLGVQYEHALKAYNGAPRKEELPPAEAEKIASGKERATLVLREKIQDSYARAVAIAGKSNLYTDWQIKAHRRLARLQPGEYQPIPEELMLPEVITHKITVKESVSKLKN